MDLYSAVLPFIFVNLFILGCQGVLILTKNELATYNSCGAEADQYVKLLCKFMYADYTTAPYLTVTWTDVTDSSNILDVANIVQNGSVSARGEYVNASITRLSDAETDGSIRLKIEDKMAGFKIFNCEVSALSDTPSIYSRPVFAHNLATLISPSAALGGAIIALSVIVAILCVLVLYFMCKKKEKQGVKIPTLVLIVLSIVLSIVAIIISAIYLSKEQCCLLECSKDLACLEIALVVCSILGFLCLVVVNILEIINRSGETHKKKDLEMTKPAPMNTTKPAPMNMSNRGQSAVSRKDVNVKVKGGNHPASPRRNSVEPVQYAKPGEKNVDGSNMRRLPPLPSGQVPPSHVLPSQVPPMEHGNEVRKLKKKSKKRSNREPK